MNYITEYTASALKAARETKGLSQRELSAKSGLPQSHISRIEAGEVDLRLSSLVALARVLGLELILTPRKAVPAVQSLVRSSTHGTLLDGKTAHLAQKELARIQKTIASLPATALSIPELAQLQRQVRELQRLRLNLPDIEALRAAKKAVKVFRNNTKNIDAIRQTLSQLQGMRNALVHDWDGGDKVEAVRPAYSLDDDDYG